MYCTRKIDIRSGGRCNVLKSHCHSSGLGLRKKEFFLRCSWRHIPTQCELAASNDRHVAPRPRCNQNREPHAYSKRSPAASDIANHMPTALETACRLPRSPRCSATEGQPRPHQKAPRPRSYFVLGRLAA